MNISDVESYIKQRKVFEIFAKSAFDYIYNNHQDILEYRKDSTYEDFYISEYWFVIKYNNGSYNFKESSEIDFLLENVLNGSWKKSLEEFKNLNNA